DVRKFLALPLNPRDHSAARADEPEPQDGIVVSSARIKWSIRLALGMREIRQREPLDARLIGLLEQDRLRIGREEKSAFAIELFGGDELGNAVRACFSAARRHANL